MFFRRLFSEKARTFIQTFIKDSPVAVFMKGTPDQPMCGFSRAVIQVLDLNGVTNYKTVNILADEEVRATAKEVTNWPTFPQVYVKGEFVGGCDILLDMHKTGELVAMLKEKEIPLAETEKE